MTDAPLIAVLPGDGIGPEVVAQGLVVLAAAAQRFGWSYRTETAPIGGAAIDATGDPLPPATLALAKRADAVYFGAVGGPRWDEPGASVRPEDGILTLRKVLDLYANLRPVKPYPALLHRSVLKEEVVRGTDLLVVRELTGGLYFGRPSRRWGPGGAGGGAAPLASRGRGSSGACGRGSGWAGPGERSLPAWER